jgi:hypothetical protein
LGLLDLDEKESKKMNDNRSLKGIFLSACAAGNVNQIRAAISLDISINCVDTSGRTGVMHCIRNNKMEAMEILLKQREIDVNMKDHSGFTALQLACHFDNSEAVEKIAKFHQSRKGTGMNGVEMNMNLNYTRHDGMLVSDREFYKTEKGKFNVLNGDNAIIMAVRGWKMLSFEVRR